MTAQLFTNDQAPRHRKKPSKLMHVVDAGSDYGHVNMVCGHCGYDDGWKIYEATISELKRGLPCPKCNEANNEKREG